MADIAATKEDPRSTIWSLIGSLKAGMLGICGTSLHFQPMAPFGEREHNRIWFITKRDTDLVRAVGAGAIAHFVMISPDHDLHCCIQGSIVPRQDDEALDRLWTPVVGAWFTEGRDDPQLTMLELTLRDAMLWASTDNGALFWWEIAKAHISGSEPAVGVHCSVTFPGEMVTAPV